MPEWQPISELKSANHGRTFFRGGIVQYFTNMAITETENVVAFKDTVRYDVDFGSFPVEVFSLNGEWIVVNKPMSVRKAIYIDAKEFCVCGPNGRAPHS